MPRRRNHPTFDSTPNRVVESHADVMKADPAARVRVVVISLVVVALAIAAAVAGRELLIPWAQLDRAAMDRLAREDPVRLLRLARWLFYGAFGFVALMTIAPGALYVRISRRIVESDQFPAPGTSVLRDTPIVRGRMAQRRGRITGFMGWGLITVGLGLFGFGHATFKQLLPDERIERLMECEGRWGPEEPCLLNEDGSVRTPIPRGAGGRSVGSGESSDETRETGPRGGPGGSPAESPTERPSDNPHARPTGPAAQLKVALH